MSAIQYAAIPFLGVGFGTLISNIVDMDSKLREDIRPMQSVVERIVKIGANILRLLGSFAFSSAALMAGTTFLGSTSLLFADAITGALYSALPRIAYGIVTVCASHLLRQST